MAATLTPQDATNESPSIDDVRIIDEPEIIEVEDEPMPGRELSWLPTGMAAQLTLSIVGVAVAALLAIALPLWLTGTSAAAAFGVASVPALFCGGGFGAIFGAALFSDDERTD